MKNDIYQPWIFVATLPLPRITPAPFRPLELLVQTLLDPSRWSRNLRARPPGFSPTHRYLIPKAQRQAVIDLA